MMTCSHYWMRPLSVSTTSETKFSLELLPRKRLLRANLINIGVITVTRRTDKKEFNGKRYVKIESDPAT